MLQNGALWDISLMHCRIFEMGLLDMSSLKFLCFRKVFVYHMTLFKMADINLVAIRVFRGVVTKVPLVDFSFSDIFYNTKLSIRSVKSRSYLVGMTVA